MKNELATYKIPLTLGITGHRDLRAEDHEILRKAVRDIFRFLQKHYPHSPLQLLSPLAQGADCLVAQVALEENIQLVTPLPLPKDLYLQDFDTHEAKDQLNELCQKAEVFQLPLVEGNTLENIIEYGQHRTQQYTLVGAFVARHSHILLALWDGETSEKTAGTAQVVQFKLTGDMKNLPQSYQPAPIHLDIPDTGPVCHILTARQQSPKNAVGLLGILRPKQPETGDIKELLSSELAALDRFNQEVEKYHAHYEKRIQNSQKNLLPPRLWEQLTLHTPMFQNIMGVYGIANTLAKHFQSGLKQRFRMTLGMAFIMILFYGWYANIQHHNVLLIIYGGLLIGIVILLAVTQWQHYQRKALDYRALAEGLRVQIFWHLAGIPCSVTDFYLLKQRDELAWIRNGIRALNVYDWLNIQQAHETVRWKWIKGEQDWFQKTARERYRWAQYLHRCSFIFWMVGILFFVALFMAQFLGEQALLLLQNFLILLIALFPATGALCRHYSQTMALEDEAKQYERMAYLFQRASEKLEAFKNDEEKCQEILLELGKETLEENGDWVLLHRKKPLDLPFSELNRPSLSKHQSGY